MLGRLSLLLSSCCHDLIPSGSIGRGSMGPGRGDLNMRRHATPKLARERRIDA